MENPSQSTYTPEELFTLKPETIKITEAKPIMPVALVLQGAPAAVPETAFQKGGFWSKNKAFLISGSIILGCVCLFIYSEKQKKKKQRQNN